MATRIRLHVAGFYKLRSSAGVKSDLDRRARAIAAAAGALGTPDAEYGTGSQQGARRPQGRWRSTVFTQNAHAMASNAKHNTLIKSLDAGRG
ncbi:hypothetical protein [Rhodococcus jostii]|uniref:hypothetical protein n=1 Tax=Rhodococcus jostii TaxID=132919 RepID=UPI0036491517